VACLDEDLSVKKPKVTIFLSSTNSTKLKALRKDLKDYLEKCGFSVIEQGNLSLKTGNLAGMLDGKVLASDLVIQIIDEDFGSKLRPGERRLLQERYPDFEVQLSKRNIKLDLKKEVSYSQLEAMLAIFHDIPVLFFMNKNLGSDTPGLQGDYIRSVLSDPGLNRRKLELNEHIHAEVLASLINSPPKPIKPRLEKETFHRLFKSTGLLLTIVFLLIQCITTLRSNHDSLPLIKEKVLGWCFGPGNAPADGVIVCDIGNFKVRINEAKRPVINRQDIAQLIDNISRTGATGIVLNMDLSLVQGEAYDKDDNLVLQNCLGLTENSRLPVFILNDRAVFQDGNPPFGEARFNKLGVIGASLDYSAHRIGWAFETPFGKSMGAAPAMLQSLHPRKAQVEERSPFPQVFNSITLNQTDASAFLIDHASIIHLDENRFSCANPKSVLENRARFLGKVVWIGPCYQLENRYRIPGSSHSWPLTLVNASAYNSLGLGGIRTVKPVVACLIAAVLIFCSFLGWWSILLRLRILGSTTGGLLTCATITGAMALIFVFSMRTFKIWDFSLLLCLFYPILLFLMSLVAEWVSAAHWKRIHPPISSSEDNVPG